MSHPTQIQFVSLLSDSFPDHFRDSRVLEIGSLDINGSVRSLFHNCDYLGLDVAPGPGVDLVCQGQEYAAPDGSFDVVISCEAMEHNPHWIATFKNMIRLCRPGGLVIMTCATTGRAEHGTSRTEPESSPLTIGIGWEYYRNLTASNFRRHLDERQLAGHGFWTKWNHYDLLFAGIKAAGPVPIDWARSTRNISDWLAPDDKRRSMRYRRFMAACTGDWYFRTMNRITDLLVWITSRMESLHRKRT
jgi:SAM-dependent methyltransferase